MAIVSRVGSMTHDDIDGFVEIDDDPFFIDDWYG